MAGEGLLSLQSRCQLSCEHLKLDTMSSFGNATEIVMPALDLREWQIPALDLGPNVTALKRELSDNITQLHKTLEHTRNNSVIVERTLNYNDIHHFCLIYLIIAVVLALGIYEYKRNIVSHVTRAISMPSINLAPENVQDIIHST